MKISVVIPTHNRADALALTLENLARQRIADPWEVIVVNNRSTDQTDRVIAGIDFPTALRLEHEETPGAAAARNAGAHVAKGEYLLFIDNDILVGPDFVARHLVSLQRRPGSWIVGQIATLPEHEATPFGRYRKSLMPLVPVTEDLRESRGLTGANFSMPRADMERLGGFDEKFNIASHEDLELAVRAWNSGISILLDPAIIGVHNDWAGTSIADFCFRQRLYCRTEPLFWRKYGADYLKKDLVAENLPPQWGTDSPKVILRKLAKQVLGNQVGQFTLVTLCRVLEATWPWPPALWRLYRLAIAGAMNKGFREGLAIYNNGTPSMKSPKPEDVKSF